MKKVMIALAAVALAGAANADASWTFQSYDNGPLYDGYKAKTVNGMSSGLLGAGYKVYIISYDYDNYHADDKSKKGDASYYTTQATFLDNLRKGQSAAEAAGNALVTETTTKGDGLVNAKTLSLSDNYTYSDCYDCKWMYVFMAVVVGNDVYLSGEANGTLDDGPILLSGTGSDTRIDVDGTAAFSSDGWYAISVPEPTGGLLMLLGMAGLALRRKRA